MKTDTTLFGDHLIAGLSGPRLSPDDERLLGEVRPAGFLLLARNFLQGRPYDEWLGALDALLTEVKSRTGRREILVSIDHEGGHVVRPPAPITRFPYARAYGSRGAEVARASARELCSLGINVSWSPCTDVHSNPANPVIGPRAFSGDPGVVAARSVEYLEALEAEGVAGCAKHYPGHGDTSTDSHFELPSVPVTRETLEARELVPFEAMVRAGVRFVMTGHIVFPEIDPGVPATMSRPLLGDVLRGRWGYEGIIVSDDLDMKAVSAEFDRPGTLERAWDAGCDMFIIARHSDPGTERAMRTAEAFGRAAAEGRLGDEGVVPARRRIAKVFSSLGPTTVTPLPRDVFNAHAALSTEVAFGA